MKGKFVIPLVLLLIAGFSASAQTDRREVRKGNREFNRGEYAAAEVDYRRALLKDSTSVPARYNLASALYRQENYQGASESMKAFGDAVMSPDVHFNAGDIALQLKDWGTAVEQFRQALLQDPGDMAAKENYTYAKKMLEDQQNGGGGGNDDPQDQNDQQNQQDQNDQQNQQDQNDQTQDNNNQDNRSEQQQDNGGNRPQPAISPQQAQQMLNAIQAREQQTQDKVNREKAAALKSRQKEKNW